MALTVGVATVLDSREVIVVVTGLRKALALSKAIGELYTPDQSPIHRFLWLTLFCITEEGVNHLVREVDFVRVIELLNGLDSGLFLLCNCTPGLLLLLTKMPLLVMKLSQP